MAGTSKLNLSVESRLAMFQPSQASVLLFASRSACDWLRKLLTCTAVAPPGPASQPQLASFWAPPSISDMGVKVMFISYSWSPPPKL